MTGTEKGAVASLANTNKAEMGEVMREA